MRRDADRVRAGGWPCDATRQSLAENAVSPFKALVGVKLAARGFANQQVEAVVKRRVLNRMASLGLPISERVLQG